MTTITESIKNVAGVAESRPLAFRSPVWRSNAAGTGSVSWRQEFIRPVDGLLTVELDPGVAEVRIEGVWRAFIVPASGTHRLWPLVQTYFEYDPPVVSLVKQYRDATEGFTAIAGVAATQAVTQAERAEAAAALASGVTTVTGATSTVPGIVRLSGDLGGTATTPVIAPDRIDRTKFTPDVRAELDSKLRRQTQALSNIASGSSGSVSFEYPGVSAYNTGFLHRITLTARNSAVVQRQVAQFHLLLRRDGAGTLADIVGFQQLQGVEFSATSGLLLITASANTEGTSITIAIANTASSGRSIYATFE